MPSSSVAAVPSLSTVATPRAFVRLMGSFGLIVDGDDCSARLTYEKVRLMLAVLALAQSQPVSRTKLARMIWPDVDVPEGRARVRHALHTLKQVFSAVPQALEVTSAEIRLRTDLVQVDVLSLVNDASTPFTIDDAQRLDLYRPPLLDTLNTSLTEEFDNWLKGWRARIEIEMAQWRQRIIDRHLQDKALSAALAHATRWAERWPEDESCHRTLIRLLVATGQHDAAMVAFEHCSRVLADRLGMAPSAETRALLGIEASAATTVSASARPRLYGREFRPMAVVAITLSWVAPQREVETAVESLAQASTDVLAEIQRSGAWVARASGGSWLAYFGFSGINETPIVGAARLTKSLSELSLPVGVHLGMGLHADVTLTEPETQTPDKAALLSQGALPLSWQARHRETLLSQSAVQRLPPSQLLTLKRGGRADYVLEQHPPSEITPRLHGRAREFDFLVGLWMRQQPGRNPTMVTVTGFPGIGKSLLANVMAEYAVQSGGQRILLSCEEAYKQVPLYPILTWLRQQYSALTARLRDVGKEEALARFCDTLGAKRVESQMIEWLLNATHMTETLLADAQQTLGAILARYSAEPQQSRLIVVENLQWADHATLSLLKKIRENPTRIPLMLIATSRAIVSEDDERTLRLGPLSDVFMAQFVAHRSRTQKLSRKQRQHVLQHSHGVPLYAILLMRQTINDLPLEYSCGLTDTLCVELQRLPPAALELAQLTALMETSLEVGTLGDILAMSQDVLQSALSALLENGMLMESSTGELVSPVMIQLAIRRMTPRKTRQGLHTLVARHLIRTDASPVMIAPHAESADEPSTPLWWQRAAVQEIRESQPRQARASLERALRHAHRIDTSEARRQFEFQCQMLLGELASVTAGPGSTQTLLAYEAADRLLPADDPKVAMFNMWGKWVTCQHTARYTEALDLAHRHMRLSIELDIPFSKGWSHYALGNTYLWCGQLTEAEHELSQCIQVLDKIPPRQDLVSIYGDHALAIVWATHALCLAMQGRAEQALTLSQESMQRAVIGGSPLTMVGCLLLGARVQYLVGSVHVAGAMCQGALAHMPPDDALGPWHAILQAYASLPAVLEGLDDEALKNFQDLVPFVEQGMPTLLNSLLCLIARGLIAKHAFEEAAAALVRAEEINRIQNSYTVEPEIYCIRGDLYLASGQVSQAQKAWQLARTSAVRHGLLAYGGWVDARLAQHPVQASAD